MEEHTECFLKCIQREKYSQSWQWAKVKIRNVISMSIPAHWASPCWIERLHIEIIFCWNLEISLLLGKTLMEMQLLVFWGPWVRPCLWSFVAPVGFSWFPQYFIHRNQRCQIQETSLLYWNTLIFDGTEHFWALVWLNTEAIYVSIPGSDSQRWWANDHIRLL